MYYTGSYFFSLKNVARAPLLPDLKSWNTIDMEYNRQQELI